MRILLDLFFFGFGFCDGTLGLKWGVCISHNILLNYLEVIFKIFQNVQMHSTLLAGR